MGVIVYLVGSLVTLLLVLYAVLYILYRLNRPDHTPYLTMEQMPAMRPEPIAAKDSISFLDKLLAMVFTVRRWKLQDHWRFHLAEDLEIVIPKGFSFDGASIPKVFWAILSPVGLLLIPGLVHDYGYRYDMLWRVGPGGEVEEYRKGAGKDYWDGLFQEVGDQVNGFSLINGIAWLAVTLGGEGAWRRYRRQGDTPERPALGSGGGATG